MKVRERQVDRLLRGMPMLEVQGVLPEDIEMPDKLRQAIADYFNGNGIPKKILRRYYGYGVSLSIEPEPALPKSYNLINN